MKETQPQRILIVDDEPSVCAAIRMMLEFYGYKSQTVGSGKEAMAFLESERFDLMVTDYSMHGIKGDELSRITKQRWPKMPVLMLTAYAGALDDNCFANADAVLSKPCSAQELRDVVASIFAACALDDLDAMDETARGQAPKRHPQSGSAHDASRNPGK